MADLSSRREQEARHEIVGTALALFRTGGFMAVSMEQVAVAVGVSRRTLYRRFPTKEHIVLAIPTGWLDVWDRAVEGLPADLPSLAVAEQAALAVARAIDADRQRVLDVYEVLEQAPWLESAGLANRDWTIRIVELINDRRRGRIRSSAAHVVAGAYLGAIDALMADWYRSGGRTKVTTLTRNALDRLRPIWPSG